MTVEERLCQLGNCPEPRHHKLIIHRDTGAAVLEIQIPDVKEIAQALQKYLIEKGMK